MIKILVMDVDGTLTDGKIYMSENGELIKAFNIKDGYAIKNILPKYGVIPVVITGRCSEIVVKRCSELGIDYVFQGYSDKTAALGQLCEQLNVTEKDIAYIGDDENDFEAMEIVSVRGCPADSSDSIIKISDYISDKNGGAGAVRDFIEWLIKENNLFND